MLVLVGETRSRRNLETLKAMGWGRMFVVRRPTPFDFELWGFDNQAFKAWQDAGFPIGLTWDDWLILWDSETFEERLAEAKRVNSDPYLAVCPDIPGAGLTSLEFSIFWRMELGPDWPWYLAVQDGMGVEDVKGSLHLFSGIFLGGTDKFKNTAQVWCDLAHRSRLKFHYGRAGTIAKLRHAYRVGADSCDSSFPLWTNERMNTFAAKYQGLGDQLCF